MAFPEGLVCPGYRAVGIVSFWDLAAALEPFVLWQVSGRANRRLCANAAMMLLAVRVPSP